MGIKEGGILLDLVETGIHSGSAKMAIPPEELEEAVIVCDNTGFVHVSTTPIQSILKCNYIHKNINMKFMNTHIFFETLIFIGQK